MPAYKVLKPGFFHGRLYDPEGKRKVLHTDKAFPKKGNKENVPSWLQRIKTETVAQKKAREAAEQQALADAVDQKDADEKDVAGASFMADPDKQSSAVDTL